MRQRHWSIIAVDRLVVLAGFFFGGLFRGFAWRRGKRLLANPARGRRMEDHAALSGHTLILETTFERPGGMVRLIDFMPIRERNSDAVRIV